MSTRSNVYFECWPVLYEKQTLYNTLFLLVKSLREISGLLAIVCHKKSSCALKYHRFRAQRELISALL